MVEARVGPVFSMIGSGLILLFGIVFYGERDWSFALGGQEAVYIRLGFMLGMGLVGFLGGFFAFRKKRYLNIIPLIVAIIAIFGLSIQVGQLVYRVDSTYTYTPVYLYSTFMIELVLIFLGFVLAVLNFITDRRLLKKGIVVAKYKEDRRKIGEILMQYVAENQGKAFSAQSLYNRCVENTTFSMSVSDIDELCYELHILGRFDLDIKENINYYFSY